MSTLLVHLARTGEAQEIRANCWREALKATGRDDACLVEPNGDALEVTFDADTPTTFSFRSRQGSGEDAVRWALENVVNDLDRQARAERQRRTLTEWADGVAPGSYRSSGQGGGSCR